MESGDEIFKIEVREDIDDKNIGAHTNVNDLGADAHAKHILLKLMEFLKTYCNIYLTMVNRRN